MTSSQKHQQGFTIVEVLLIVLVLAVISFGGYFVWRTQHKTTPTLTTTSSNITTTSSTAKSSNTASTDPTAGWATYTSSTGGFSFKYPTTGWTLSGERNPGVTTVTGSQLNGSEYDVTLKENEGVGLSTSANQYYIVMFLGSTSSTDGLDNYVNAQANPSYYANEYKQGTVSTLSNGVQLWSSNSNGGTSCNNGSVLQLVNNSNFYTTLSNGQLMEWEASFCYGYKATTTLSYQQQTSSSEATVAKELLASYKF